MDQCARSVFLTANELEILDPVPWLKQLDSFVFDWLGSKISKPSEIRLLCLGD